MYHTLTVTVVLINTRLVPNWIQGWDQLPTSHRGAWRGPLQSPEGGLLSLQHHCHHGGLGKTRPQVRPDVCQESFCPLVCRRRNGGGRVLRGKGGPCST